MKKLLYIDTPAGKIGIAGTVNAVTDIFFAIESTPDWELGSWPVLEEAAQQLQDYFNGKRTGFDFPLTLTGTDFQKRVWNALITIPYGETRSYKEVAELAGSPKGFRAVGMANHCNPAVIVVPCHRVIAHDGSLGGFGAGLTVKKMLLDLEAKAR